MQTDVENFHGVIYLFIRHYFKSIQSEIVKMKFGRNKSDKKDRLQFTNQTKSHLTKLPILLTNFIYQRASPM